MSIAANKVKGVRAALCNDCYSAAKARQHNNANVLCMGARVLGPGLAQEIMEAYLNASFLGSYHEAVWKRSWPLKIKEVLNVKLEELVQELEESIEELIRKGNAKEEASLSLAAPRVRS